MRDYVAVLLEQGSSDTAPEQAASYQQGVARTAAFQSKLREFLSARGVADQVAWLGDPTVFPLVMFRCTPEVARLVETLPDVREVVPDFPGFEMLSGGAASLP